MASRICFFNALNNMRRVFLDKKPHIKEYYKIRKMHSEILSAMVQYYHDGKFEKQMDTNFIPETEPQETVTIHLLESSFDLDTKVGAQAFYDIWIYKTASNATCIAEDFIQKHRYRKPEKIEFLHSMLNSNLGLFEVTGTDMKEVYAHLKDVLTGDEYTIVDLGLSSNMADNSDIYIYTRIISHNGINFSSGLNFLFKKTDSFIKNHIQQHKKDFNPNGEFQRFTQLYNHYFQDSNRIRAVTNEL